MISVVIITLNEELYLPRLLDSLAKQTYKDFEEEGLRDVRDS